MSEKLIQTTASYPEYWLPCKLSDALTLINGRAYKKSEMLSEGTPILRIQNLNGGNNWFYSDLNLPDDKYCHKGDLLYAWSATFGPYWSRWEDKLIYHYHIWKVVPAELISKKFSFYELWRITDAIKLAAHGVAMPHITKEGMDNWPIILPPLAEQHQIAQRLDELLGQVDTIKARLDAIPAILKRFRQSVLSAAVSGKLTEEWRGNRAFDHFCTLGSITNDIRYGTSKKCDSETGDTPVLRIPNISNGYVDLSDLKFADFENNEMEKLKLKKGDILVIRSNGSVELVGKSALIDEKTTHCLFAGYLIRLRFKQDSVVPKYILYCIQSPETRKTIELQARSTSGVNNINSKELADLVFAIPEIAEQTEIVQRVEQFFTFANQIEQRVNDAKARVDKLTQSILAKAFRGELTADWRAEHPELISGENSAEALLAKIQAAKATLDGKKKKGKAA